MTITISQAIEGLSKYLIGTGKDITDAQLVTYQALVADELVSLNNSRLTGDSLIKLEAYLVLDLFVNKAGSGVITEEKIKDYSYKAVIGTSSYFRDAALSMLAQYDTSLSCDIDIGDGVNRDDVYIKNITSAFEDGTGGYEY